MEALASSGEQTRGTHEDSGMRDGAEEETLRDGGDNDGCPPAGGGGSRSAEVRLEDDGAMIASLIDGEAEKKIDMELVAALAADAMRRPYRTAAEGSDDGAKRAAGSCASAAASPQAECRLLESCAPSGIAGQDMADSGEGAAKRCEMDVGLPSRSSDGGGEQVESASSRERFEIYPTHGRTQARVECGLALHLPLHLTLHQPPNRSVRSCHSSRLVIRVPPVGPWRDRTDGQVLCSVQIKSLDKKLRKLDAAMTHAKDDPSLLAPMASKANAGVAADGRELSRGAPAAEAELKRGGGRQVGSKNTARTGLHDLQDKTLFQVCKDLGLAWIDQAQAIAAIHLRSGSSAKSPKTNLDGLKEDTLALICADRNLASSGNRAELIARILGRGGARICPHQRKRSACKECGGAEFCPHQRKRSQCKECGGASICPHQRQRSR